MGEITNYKSIFTSKTFWFAVVQGVIGLVVVFESSYPGVGGLVIAKSVLDIILRYLTVQPVTL